MAYETLLTEIDDGILTLTLNRPDRMNAFTTQMLHDLLQGDKDHRHRGWNTCRIPTGIG